MYDVDCNCCSLQIMTVFWSNDSLSIIFTFSSIHIIGKVEAFMDAPLPMDMCKRLSLSHRELFEYIREDLSQCDHFNRTIIGISLVPLVIHPSDAS